MSRIIFDLSFIFTFFGNPAFTLESIKEKTTAICEAWNMKYSGKPEVKNKYISLTFKRLAGRPYPSSGQFVCIF